MCGIYASVEHSTGSNTGAAAREVFGGLKKLEYRGYDSWGIATRSPNGGMSVIKLIGKMPESEAALSRPLPESDIAIGHTRWATHGGVTEANAHPHLDCEEKLAVVHNGIIENYQNLKNRMLSSGHQFKSETDTEVIPHMLEELTASGLSLVESLRLVYSQLEGMNAVIVCEGKNLVAVKGGSPLVAGKTDNGYLLSSDPKVLLSKTRELFFPEKGDMLVLNGTAELHTADGKHTQPEFRLFNWKVDVANRGVFPHFLIKEIYDQPEALQRLLEDEKGLEAASKLLNDASQIYFLGCGTALNACFVGAGIFSKLAGRRVLVEAASEFDNLQPYLKPEDLIMAVSQSGETIDVLDQTRRAQENGTKVIALTNSEGSSLYREADHTVLLESGIETAVLATKSFTSMVARMTQLAAILGGVDSKKIIREDIEAAYEVLKTEAEIAKVAETLKDNEHIYILGKGPSYAVAKEMALKIKEGSYIHAEGFAAGELKHGVIALVEDDTPVIVIVPNDVTKPSILSSAAEVRARGARVIGIGVENDAVFDTYIPVPDSGLSSQIPVTIAGQILAYHLTLLRGFDPDKPRNLAKSVTVH